jgi:hypothetical protein
MNKQQLHTLLGGLSGHLITDSPEAEREYQRLHQLLSRASLPPDLQQIKGSQFSFESADLFAPENLQPERADYLQAIATRKTETEDASEYRVFMREAPVRSTQLPGSVPLWAGGAAIEETIGPFTHLDGRQFWFDFFKIEKLVALYVQGRPDPALLFKIRTGFRLIDINLPFAADIAASYQLVAGSVWINAGLLATGAPAGEYVGLTMQRGTVALSAAPQLINGKLTVAPNTIVTVSLQLRQPAVTNADAASPYGIDARNAMVELPEQFSFHFSSVSTTVDGVGAAQWRVYGDEASFRWSNGQPIVYDNTLHRVLLPMSSSAQEFNVRDCQSSFLTLQGAAPITNSYWALPAAALDVINPTPAAGIGGLLVKCSKGLSADWRGLQGGALNLNQPYVLADPGRIGITDLAASNLFGAQNFKLWLDEQNRFGTSVEMRYAQATPFFYNSFANGNEALLVFGNADVQIDRPVTAAGEALAIKSKNSALMLAANKTQRLIYLYDDNIFFDSIDATKKPLVLPQPIALALRNALFKVTPVNGCLLFGQLAEDFIKVERSVLFLTFGLHAYLPTLPDPYAANLNNLRWQFREQGGRLFASTAGAAQSVWMWLVCQVRWEPAPSPNDEEEGQFDRVAVSFHFAPLQNQFQIPPAAPADANALTVAHPLFPQRDFPNSDRPLNYGQIWDNNTRQFQQDTFALLDVSTNADLLGVSFGLFGNRRMQLLTTHSVAATNETTAAFPLQVQGMDVVTQGVNARAFTVPQISWEPVLNLSEKNLDLDPPPGANYYEDDGGPTRIGSLSVQFVPLAPLPLTKFIIDNYNTKQTPVWSLFTLPFGLRALALLEEQSTNAKTPKLRLTAPQFPDELEGGAQITMQAGRVDQPGESNRFTSGYTVQTANVLNPYGQKTVITADGTISGYSTLGQSVTEIFNNEFLLDAQEQGIERGVPLTRIDFAGYGASIFSHWQNPNAVVAKTSQAKFDVWRGRTAHEVIQVRSLLYPWGVRVVRTISLFRTATGYVYRVDSGWRAESDGQFDFTYKVYEKVAGKLEVKPRDPNYEFHTGVVRRLINIQEIKETKEIQPFLATWKKNAGETFINVNGEEVKLAAALDLDVKLQPVFFNADVLIENVTQGNRGQVVENIFTKPYQFGRVPSKGILGFVQIAPSGEPIPAKILADLILSQFGSIGGPIDCVVNIGGSNQRMRLNRFDVSNAKAANNSSDIFVVSGRGNVVLPKDGSWGLVKHQHGTGEVNPVPEDLSVPLVRIGKLKKVGEQMLPDADPAAQLLRIANPTELLRAPLNDTINYGFLHSTDTQKALFLTPSFKQGVQKLMSKTPPLFADAFRIVNSKGVFPNIGDAVNNFGDVISLVSSGTEFVKNAATDAGKNVYELMDIGKVAGEAIEEGYKLAKKLPLNDGFRLPATSWNLIEIGAFKIYIEYKATPTGSGTIDGKLNFDVDSFAANVADRWRSQMNNVAIVVDLGPIKRLMTIKGNWDAHKGAEAEYRGEPGSLLPSPQIEFSPELEPVIQILQILQDLQGENYKDAFSRGLKLAMSNKAGSWEYKFEAAKEIPVVRFPPGLLYNDPNAPLKLEAGLKLGAYFNAALKVTTDPKQLLPTAGGFLGFYGRLSVMCVSLSVATVYAVGQANLDIGADTKTGPMLRMKFGFGAQLVIGLPVVGNVSVLYMVGVEIYLDATKVNVSAFLLFQGHAELLGGLVAVTITIEAKGTVSRQNDRTDLAAQVTFGLDISIFLVINISFSTSWQEQRQIA